MLLDLADRIPYNAVRESTGGVCALAFLCACE